MLRPIDLTQETVLKTTLGCSVIDGFLRGESTAGKTQLVLQSLLTVQLPQSEGGLNGKAVYIYTEGKPPVERLQAILANRFQGRPDVSLANVLIEERPIATPEDLLRSVRQLEALLEREAAVPPLPPPHLTSGGGAAGASGGRRVVRLLVIDSVARVFRDVAEGDEPQVQQLQRRATQLFGLATLLKRLAQQHQLAVLLTNQVMDDFNDSDSQAVTSRPFLQLMCGLDLTYILYWGPHGVRGPPIWQVTAPGSRAAPLLSSGRRVLPALGLAWANCVNCRLFAARHDSWNGVVVRSLQVVFAPYLPHSYCCFRVDHQGVWGLAEESGDDGLGANKPLPPSDVQPLR
ncbi:DNA repair protein (X-ray repair) [Volvox carteri f. nagariensis]|uniref:DNA repair protein (X-ray repair) n=1 Tax=Volvox carteri f. nagariensis TaxID=3068 RepID=D8THP9_VOLCA|nr:DNA repair protein (X-ray repair) [Volvox carteri f. nagariensis]EFJ52752.1 DNA repair protein (X-ray repair) [Volvox carteri f. nagariensis]|eukprot:XP_002945757.1 DNA repair protein (X-ray repair) [Volvox carteri f. nagariensis]